MAYAPFIEDIKIYKGTTFSYQFNFDENGSALDLTTLSDIEVTFSKPGKQIFSHTVSGGNLTISGADDNELTGTADADTMDIGARSYDMVITFTFPDGSKNVYVYFNARIIIGDSQTAHEWNIEIDTDAETTSGEQLTGLTSRAIQAASDAETLRDSIYPTQETGTEISFDTHKIFGQPSSPESGNLTQNLTDARTGVIQKIYHDDSSEPSYPAEWVKVGLETYSTSELNIIFAEYVNSNRIEYWIVQ